MYSISIVKTVKWESWLQLIPNYLDDKKKRKQTRSTFTGTRQGRIHLYVYVYVLQSCCFIWLLISYRLYFISTKLVTST